MTKATAPERVDERRRQVVKKGVGLGVLSLLVAAGIFPAETVLADERALFKTDSLRETLEVLGVSERPPSSDAVRLDVPDVADNGAKVPVTLHSEIEGTDAIWLLVENNPNMVAARFDFPSGTVPKVRTFVKMNETSDVYALVKSGDDFYMARRHVQVTLGGCG